MDIEISRRLFILGIWLICALASAFTKSSDCIGIAFCFTLFYAFWVMV